MRICTRTPFDKRERPGQTAHFIAVCLVTWPLNGLYFHLKGSEIYIKTKSTRASLPFKGLVTKHATVKRTIKPLYANNEKNVHLLKRRHLLQTQSENAKTVAENT